MNESGIQRVMTKARDCAMTMFENAMYVQNELSNVSVDDALRSRTNEVCESLIGTKHDVISEIFRLDELSCTKDSGKEIKARIDLILKWFLEDITELHRLVKDLESASKEGTSSISAYILVAESATNILMAFNQFRDAADSWTVEADRSKDQ